MSNDPISDTVAQLIAQAEQAATTQTDCLAELVRAIHAVIDTHLDPFALAGALVEGAAVTILTRVSTDRRPEVAAAAVRLLYDRLEAGGAF